jgi:phytanoyl-CoA hydroxylase
MLSADTAVDDFTKNGFTVFRGVLDADLVEEARAHVEWLGQRYPHLRPEEYHHPLMRNDAFWVRLVTDSRLLDIAERFLGPDLACFTAHYVCKPPQDGQPVLWHQDGAYWKLKPMTAVAAWVAVDESTRENGCLRMVPGSHDLPIYPPSVRTDIANMLYSQTREDVVRSWVDQAGVVDIELLPGDVSVHHPNILHCSEPNTSAKRRCGLDIGYIPTSTTVANEGLYLDPLLVRGKPGAGANQYRAYPPYLPEETIPFRGHETWNTRITETNRLGEFTERNGASETPLDATHRMVRRLREGTVGQ